MLAACAAPAIVRAQSLMRVRPIEIATLEEVIEFGGNTLLTPAMISREALRILEKNLRFAEHVNSSWADDFVNAGSTLTIRRPNRFT